MPAAPPVYRRALSFESSTVVTHAAVVRRGRVGAASELPRPARAAAPH